MIEIYPSKSTTRTIQFKSINYLLNYYYLKLVERYYNKEYFLKSLKT